MASDAIMAMFSIDQDTVVPKESRFTLKGSPGRKQRRQAEKDARRQDGKQRAVNDTAMARQLKKRMSA